MMKSKELFYIDILNSIEEIESYFPDKFYNFNDFLNDIKTKRAVERNLAIIGEAVNQLLKIDNNISISSARQIVDMRNRIIHNYDNLSYEIIWGIIVKYIPLLKNEIISLSRSPVDI